MRGKSFIDNDVHERGLSTYRAGSRPSPETSIFARLPPSFTTVPTLNDVGIIHFALVDRVNTNPDIIFTSSQFNSVLARPDGPSKHPSALSPCKQT